MKDSDHRKTQIMALPQVNLIESQVCAPTPSAGYACLSLQTLVVSTLDNQLQDLMTVDDPRVKYVHQFVGKLEMCNDKESALRQYGRNSELKVDPAEQKRVWNKLYRDGLVGVHPTPTGIDQIDGTVEELEASLQNLNRHQETSRRNIDEENEQGEDDEPALGGDPSNIDQGYHYERQLTKEELAAQLQLEETRLRAQPWFDSRISRTVDTMYRQGQRR